MTSLLLILLPAVFGMYWIIRYQMSVSRRRRLVENYGLDRKKLNKLSYVELKALQKNIKGLSGGNNAYAVEELIRPYRP
jgi:hypothetical protein